MLATEPPLIIAVDWGTSSLRAALLERGAVVQERATDRGVLRVQPGRHGTVLADLLKGWPTGAPIIVSGMAGSDIGWVEVPHLQLPAHATDIAAAMLPLGPEHLGRPLAGRRVLVVPGLVQRDRDGEVDVMRGEETQVLGCQVEDGVVVLPGSHSKWVEVRAGLVRRFRTYFTGEAYAALARHTILRHSVGSGSSSNALEAGLPEESFNAALQDHLRRAVLRPEALLHGLFTVRTAGLHGATSEAGAAKLSALLVGAEIADASGWAAPGDTVTLCADPKFLPVYSAALQVLGRDVRHVSGSAAARGAWRLAGLREEL